VVVWGAGPAGLRFAAAASIRGYEVTVYERAERPGGRLAQLASLPGRSSWQGAIDNLLRPVETGAVRLELGVDPEVILAPSLEAEHRVLAIGAQFDPTGYSAYRPDRSEIPTMDGARVIGMDEAISATMIDAGALGGRVLIVDDGYDEWAAGLAERIAAGGVQVRIASPRAWWGESLARTYDIAYVMPRLRKLGVEILTQHFVDRVEPGCAWIYELWTPGVAKPIAADTVVLALGRVTREPRQTSVRFTSRVGDCLAPRTIEAVIYEGEIAGRQI
jgi:glycine/D-amino acid oxidase-like deaminating enzyme